MAAIILFMMIGVPILEIVVFIRAGELIGLWPTVLTVVLTAFMGTALLRHQGLATLRKVQDGMNAGRPPVAELFDGLCLFVAGILLLTPGFVTDAIGFLLFVPPLRTFILGGLVARLSVSMQGGFQARPGAGFGDREGGGRFDETIIEGEFHEVDTDTRPKPGPDDHSDNKLQPPR